MPAQVPTNAPRQQAPDPQNVPTDEHGNLLVWTGLGTQLYEAICDALDSSHIAHTDTHREVGLPSLGQKVLFIWVNPRDWKTASALRENALKQPMIIDRDDFRWHANDASLDPFGFGKPVYPGEMAPERRVNPFRGASTESLFADPGDSVEVAPDDIAANFNAEDATNEVWTGKDLDMAETVRLCRRENGIGCVVEERDGGRAVLVTPESETRAKEIIDQIVRGAPS